MIPYGRHWIEDDDIEAVVEVLRHGWLTQGPAVPTFERAIAERCGVTHAVACNSGTSALHLAMLAAGVGPGDEIVAPAISFVATANCGLYVGAEPRFADVDPHSAAMTPELLRPALTSKTRAVLPVHFAGAPCDMPALSALIREVCPEALIVEDACHALGASHPDGSAVGALRWADMAMFSFHPVKHVAAGEGGVILTDDDRIAERLAEFRSHGTTRDPSRLQRKDVGPWHYEMHRLGHNYRMPDMNAALGLSQFLKLDRFVERRRAIAARYHTELVDLGHCRRPTPEDVNASSWHLYVLHIDFEALGKTRPRVVSELADLGIGTQVHYAPIPLQPYYQGRFGGSPEDYPGAVSHHDQALTIPLFPAMTDDDVKLVVSALHTVLGPA